MIKQQHIEKMKLLGKILNGVSLPAEAVNAAIEYARRLTADPALQAEVKAAYKSDLAARDLKRAAQAVAKYSKTPEPVTLPVNAVPSETVTPTPVPYKPKPGELVSLGILVPNIRGSFDFTAKGLAWKHAGKPDPATWQPTS